MPDTASMNPDDSIGAGPAEARPEPDPGHEAGRSPLEEEIMLTEGKTLSDFLEPEAEPPSTEKKDAAEYRSVPNVASLVVPPPGGVGRGAGADSRAGKGPARSSAGPDRAAGAQPVGGRK